MSVLVSIDCLEHVLFVPGATAVAIPYWSSPSPLEASLFATATDRLAIPFIPVLCNPQSEVDWVTGKLAGGVQLRKRRVGVLPDQEHGALGCVALVPNVCRHRANITRLHDDPRARSAGIPMGSSSMISMEPFS
jgi:hypothetical protein